MVQPTNRHAGEGQHPAAQDSGLRQNDLLHALTPLSWQERLLALRDMADKRIVFSTSFSHEDQMITHAIAEHDVPVQLFTLDTGRLFEETHEVFQRTREAYPALAIHTYVPDTRGIEALLAAQGTNGFYQSKENRLACCHVRKVEPLARALEGADIWISGLRRAHSANRADLPVVEWDAERKIIKLYPLIDVEDAQMHDYIAEHRIPYNALHDRGFPSIGCAPCTRAVQEGEDPRAGRWWWEDASAQECGLHMVDGKLVRVKQDA